MGQQRESQVVLQGEWYEDIVDQLAVSTLEAAAQLPPGRQWLVAIAGAPGSGKSTTAQLAADRINELASQRGLTSGASAGGAFAVCVPMDGFHYYRRELDAMPDPQEAHARRGAHWTFDAAAFVATVHAIRQTGAAEVPSFDHAVGDPCPGDIVVTPSNRVVLLEGNYLLLEEQPWVQLRGLVDDTWFVDVDLDVAMGRIFERQTRSVGLPPEVSRKRIAHNDRPNAEQVAATRRAARVVLPSAAPLRRSTSSSASSSPGSSSSTLYESIASL